MTNRKKKLFIIGIVSSLFILLGTWLWSVQLLKGEEKSLDPKTTYPFIKDRLGVDNILNPNVNAGRDRVANSTELLPKEYSFYIKPNSKTKRNFVNHTPTENKNPGWGHILEYRIRDIDLSDPIIIEYNNIGIYENKDINLKIIIEDIYDITTDLSPSGGYLRIRKKENDPLMFYTAGIGYIKMKYEFYDENNKKIELKGYLTAMDIENIEAVAIPDFDNSPVEKVYLTDDTDLETYLMGSTTGLSDYLVSQAVPGSGASGELTPQAFSTYTFSGESLSFVYYFTSWLKNKPSNSWTYSIRDYSMAGFSVFETTSFKTRQTEIEQPTKIVTDVDEDDERENLKENTLNHINEKFIYDIFHNVSAEREEWRFDSYEFVDQLPKALKIEDVKIFEDLTDTDVSDQFIINKDITNSLVSAKLKNPEDAKFYGETYQFKIEVSVKPNFDLEEYLDVVNKRLVFKNTGSVWIKQKDKKNVDKYLTNEVVTYAPAPGRVQIMKKDKETNLPLAGGEFEVYNKNDLSKPEFVGTTDQTGILAEYFWKGTYIIKEVKAPNGYTIDAPATQTVEIPDNARIEPPIEVVFTDTLIKPIPNVTKTASLITAKINDVFEYTITVKNDAPKDIGIWTDVVMTDEVPAELEVEKSSLPSGVTVTGNKIIWPIGNIKGQEKKVLTFKVKALIYSPNLINNKAVAIGKDLHRDDKYYSDEDDVDINLENRFLHIRQVVLNSNNEITLPKKGYYVSKNTEKKSDVKSNKTASLTSNSTIIDNQSEIELGLFKNVELILVTNSPWVTIVPSIPEYYEYVGHIQTNNSLNLGINHLSNKLKPESKLEMIDLDYTSAKEYWVTVFIQPKFGTSETSPRLYSWDTRLNSFGQIVK